MEYCEIDEKGETSEIIEFESFIIEEKGNKYNLDVIFNLEGNYITLSINDKNQFPPTYFAKTMNFKQIKELNESFKSFQTFNDFYIYLKTLSIENKLNIQKEKEILSIINKDIKIDLIPSKRSLELYMKDIYEELSNIKEKLKEIDILKKENTDLKCRIDILEKDNQKLKSELLPKNENIIKNKNNEKKLKVHL